MQPLYKCLPQNRRDYYMVAFQWLLVRQAVQTGEVDVYDVMMGWRFLWYKRVDKEGEQRKRWPYLDQIFQ
jgi:hypothetical protein